MIQSLLQRFWLGLAAIPVVILAAVLITELRDLVFGIWDWMEFSAILLVLAVILLALAEEFVRPPNPYSRTHHVYDLRDVANQPDLQSASPTMLWQALPPAIAAAALFSISMA